MLVFFLVGSACSFLNELTAAVLNRRAIHLQRWFVKLFGLDEEGRDGFLNHPLIRQLRGTRLDLRHDRREASPGVPSAEKAPSGLRGLRYSKVPSYISAATFATTVLSLLGRTDEGRATPATAQELRTAIDTHFKESGLQGVLRSLLNDAGGEIGEFRRRLEQWYDEEMDRLSGWYKRRTKWFLLLWGLGLALVLNVDTALLARTLWTDSTLRSAVVAEAQRVATPAPYGCPSAGPVGHSSRAPTTAPTAAPRTIPGTGG